MFWWPNTNTNIIWFEKITQIRIRILLLGLNYSNNIQIPNYSLTSASHGGHHHIIHGVPHTNVIRFEEKSWPNTNTNIIRFENINRIRIRIFWYSNIIRIIFKYRIIRSPLALKPVKAHYCAQRQNIKEYKRTIYFQKVQTRCIFYWSPPHTFQVLWSGW